MWPPRNVSLAMAEPSRPKLTPTRPTLEPPRPPAAIPQGAAAIPRGPAGWSLGEQPRAREQLPLLQRHALDAGAREAQERAHLALVERRALARALHLDEAALAGHHHVHVHVGAGILDIVEVDARVALHEADRDRSDRVLERGPRELVLVREPHERIVQRHERAVDRGGARAAIGLEHVAVERDRALAERGEI